ncbi:hypothetical protein N0V90_008179 [Kalmusia sp. IMI 367209]|nr:hypothetical protein N0V90_008179 [Kalmusia sp. IMI 367209]
MRYLSAAIAVAATSVAAQDRCDTAHPTINCDTVPGIVQYRNTDCRPYHIFVTRGTDEVKPGRLGNITALVCDNLGGTEQCGWEDVDYPAANRFISDSSWCESAATGVRNGQAQLTAYAQRCPDSKIIMFGYSQGATVTQDLLGSGGGPLFDKCTQASNAGLDRSQAPGSNVAAVVTFGTVRRSPSEPYSVGPGKDYQPEALRTEEQKAGLDHYASVLRDYCNSGDQYCAKSSTPLDLEFHLTYFETYQKDVVDWVVGTVNSV